MGRIQKFDRPTVVRAARDEFWNTGYEATTVTDLERATRVNRSSLYHAFGSKRGLFDVAVADYLDAVARPRLRVLLSGSSDASGLGAYFDGLAVETSRRGCLLVNCAAGLAGHDAEARAVVDTYRAELTAALRHALAAASPAVVATRTEVDARARILASLSMSAMLIARINREEAMAVLAAARDQATTWIEGTHRAPHGAVRPGDPGGRAAH